MSVRSAEHFSRRTCLFRDTIPLTFKRRRLICRFAVRGAAPPLRSGDTAGSAAGAGTSGICPPSRRQKGCGRLETQGARGADQPGAAPAGTGGVFDSGGDEGLLRRGGGSPGASLEADGLRDFQRAALRRKAGAGAAGAAPRVFCKVSNSGRREAPGHCPGWYGGLCSGVRTLKRTAGLLLAGASDPDPRRRLRPCLA